MISWQGGGGQGELFLLGAAGEQEDQVNLSAPQTFSPLQGKPPAARLLHPGGRATLR